MDLLKPPTLLAQQPKSAKRDKSFFLVLPKLPYLASMFIF